jgi:hypothetical protein
LSATTTSSCRAALRVVSALLFTALLAGCSRSNLNDYTLEEGGLADAPLDSPVDSGDSGMPEVATCNAATCPTGCCDATGLCQTGASLTQCGAGGEACQNCQARGFTVCDPTQHACGNVVPVCQPGSCAGCCVGNTCFAGTDPTECGLGAEACQNCQSQGETCANGSCVQMQGCGPQNCSGCCAGNTCLPGNSSTACGIKGQQCASCTAIGEACNGLGQCVGGQQCGPGNCGGCCEGNVCTSGSSGQACGFGGAQCQNCSALGDSCQNQTCVGQTGCGPQTCPFGCCEGNTCVAGGSSTACGFGGGQCQNCSAFGETCQNQSCTQPCGPQTCGFGCCLGNFCQQGFLDNACGAGGGQCQNCATFGELCQNQTCVSQSMCNPQTCPTGCCQGNTCVGGSSQTACGTGGALCQNCTTLGDVCKGQTCIGMGTCGPATCPFGCCQGGACVSGGSSTACGGGGSQCQDCAALGDSCQNQACVAPCNPQSCPFGCCQGNVCLPGTTDTECGFGGQCQSCVAMGETCQNQSCQSACNPSNCQGCCDATQTCQPGFLDTQCGGFGNSCQNCSALTPPSTCNGALSPPACASQQMQCPAPYGGCFAPPTQPPAMQPVCSPSDLQNAAAACAGGAYTQACFNFFNFEGTQNPACAQCLQPFDFQFADQDGIFACIAPFVSATCNQDTACTYDCTSQSCGQCPDQTTYNQCEQNVGTGQCSSFQTPATQCEQKAFSGPGAFCNPAGYPNYGQWLKGVGTNYCGGGPVDAGAGG